jgi:uncharacterized repeat protein (TIGR01451 family)
MSHRSALFRGWLVLAALGVSTLVILILLAASRTMSVSAQAWDDVTISKSVSDTNVSPGTVVTYTVTFTNSGSVAASATMSDVIPFGTSYVGGSVTGGASYDPGPPARVVWSSTLSPGQVQVVTFRVLVQEPGTLGPLPIQNHACITYGAAPHIRCTNMVWIYSRQIAWGDVTVSKSVSDINVSPGTEVTYTVTFTNGGSVAASALMTDLIPFGTTYVGGSATGGASYDPGPPVQVVWSGTLSAGQVQVVTFRVLVQQPGTAGPLPIQNHACVTYGALHMTCTNMVWIYSSRPVTLVYLPLVLKNYEYTTPWPWIQPGGQR